MKSLCTSTLPCPPLPFVAESIASIHNQLSHVERQLHRPESRPLHASNPAHNAPQRHSNGSVRGHTCSPGSVGRQPISSWLTAGNSVICSHLSPLLLNTLHNWQTCISLCHRESWKNRSSSASLHELPQLTTAPMCRVLYSYSHKRSCDIGTLLRTGR